MPSREDKLSTIRVAAIQIGIAAIFAALVLGLWRLQVVRGQNYHAMAEANRIRKVPILAPRGKIFDREGRLMVDNYPSVSCFLVREPGHDITADLPLIARGLNMTVAQIQQILKRYRYAPRYQPLPLRQDITPDEVAFIAAHKDELPELDTIREERRLYPRNGFAANLIGYVGLVSEQMLNNDPQYALYQPGDVVGRSGVEASYDSWLRGIDGSQDIAVNSHGHEVGRLGVEPAVPGKNLRLTIDLDLQKAAENALGDRDGAVIAMDPHNGQILAMVSRPTFNPNDFTVHISQKEWNSLITDPDHPLMNKTIQAQLAPGSMFKVIVSLAGLQQGVAQNLTVDCQGGIRLYGHWFGCDQHHGVVDIEKAIPWSCDSFFYVLATKLGIDTIARYAHEVGIGRRTGVDLPDEATGLMPSTEWKLRVLHQKWYPGETPSVGIGQGAVQVTPIQMARAVAGIASGGVLEWPHVVFQNQLNRRMREQIREEFPGTRNATVQESTSTWETITDAMYRTVNGGPFATAHQDRLNGIDFAGKTGTAQVVSQSAGADRVSSVLARRANGWFVGITPRRNPDIVVVVLWEHGGWGSGAAPIAAKVIEAFVDKQRQLHHNLVTDEKARLDVGAVWSDTQHPNAFGGKPLPGLAREGVNPALSSVRGGHFWVKIPAEAAAQLP